MKRNGLNLSDLASHLRQYVEVVDWSKPITIRTADGDYFVAAAHCEFDGTIVVDMGQPR